LADVAKGGDGAKSAETMCSRRLPETSHNAVRPYRVAIGRERRESRWVVGASGDVRGSRPLAHAHLINAGFQECACKRCPGKSGSPPRWRPLGLALVLRSQQPRPRTLKCRPPKQGSVSRNFRWQRRKRGSAPRFPIESAYCPAKSC
jgi:hypothetical protein